MEATSSAISLGQDVVYISGNNGIYLENETYLDGDTYAGANFQAGSTGLSNVTLHGLVEPEEDDDAATKKYVDDAIAAAITDVLEASY